MDGLKLTEVYCTHCTRHVPDRRDPLISKIKFFPMHHALNELLQAYKPSCSVVGWLVGWSKFTESAVNFTSMLLSEHLSPWRSSLG